MNRLNCLNLRIANADRLDPNRLNLRLDPNLRNQLMNLESLKDPKNHPNLRNQHRLSNPTPLKTPLISSMNSTLVNLLFSNILLHAVWL
jgi:hypothetical protein